MMALPGTLVLSLEIATWRVLKSISSCSYWSLHNQHLAATLVNCKSGFNNQIKSQLCMLNIFDWGSGFIHYLNERAGWSKFKWLKRKKSLGSGPMYSEQNQTMCQLPKPLQSKPDNRRRCLPESANILTRLCFHCMGASAHSPSVCSGCTVVLTLQMTGGGFFFSFFSFFLQLPANPETHQPVLWSQELIADPAISHAIECN